jgi:hypothetical protein
MAKVFGDQVQLEEEFNADYEPTSEGPLTPCRMWSSSPLVQAFLESVISNGRYRRVCTNYRFGFEAAP